MALELLALLPPTTKAFHAPDCPVKILPAAFFMVVPVRVVSPEQVALTPPLAPPKPL